MSEYSTDEEQVEAIRRWWDEWGRSILIGLGLAAAGSFGWRTWEQTEQSRAEQGSERWAQYVQAARRADTVAAVNPDDPAISSRDYAADAIRAEYPDTGYAAFVALDAARIAVAAGDLDRARAALQDVLEMDVSPRLNAFAGLRLARVEFAAGAHDAALAQLDRITESGFAPAVGELRGDILHAAGDVDGAREAYADAWARSGDAPSAILRLKLADLGGDV